MRFLSKSDIRPLFEGKSVAIVGSGPGILGNRPGLVDSHDVVVRVNNYKIVDGRTGHRCDVYYSFFGKSITKTPRELLADGVKVCMAKCPNAHAIESGWHRIQGKMNGVDFRWIYQEREGWWPCDVYIPSEIDFLATFHMLGRRVPTTGFAAIVDILEFKPAELFLTGFDGFRSGIHNLDERWKARNSKDPIGHVPERELEIMAGMVVRNGIKTDAALAGVLKTVKVAA